MIEAIPDRSRTWAMEALRGNFDERVRELQVTLRDDPDAAPFVLDRFYALANRLFAQGWACTNPLCSTAFRSCLVNETVTDGLRMRSNACCDYCEHPITCTACLQDLHGHCGNVAARLPGPHQTTDVADCACSTRGHPGVNR